LPQALIFVLKGDFKALERYAETGVQRAINGSFFVSLYHIYVPRVPVKGREGGRKGERDP